MAVAGRGSLLGSPLAGLGPGWAAENSQEESCPGDVFGGRAAVLCEPTQGGTATGLGGTRVPVRSWLLSPLFPLALGDLLGSSCPSPRGNAAAAKMCCLQQLLWSGRCAAPACLGLAVFGDIQLVTVTVLLGTSIQSWFF